jgi:hypothetical protein
MEQELPVEMYQDMYARLLELGREQIIRLHSSLETGETDAVLNFLKKRCQRKDNTELETHARILQQTRRKKLRTNRKRITK